MMLAHQSRILVRYVLSLAALYGAGVGVQAGPVEDVRQAQASLRIGDVFNAMALLRKAADQNHPLAQPRLADLTHAALDARVRSLLAAKDAR